MCGCYYRVASEKRYLPQVQLKSHTTILRSTSETNLQQTFSNSSEDSIKECIYTFPLYDGVSVVSFDCYVGDRIISGTVKEKRKAKAIYKNAAARGETAALLDQLPEASDVFSTSLGNIPGGEAVLVQITYVGELKHNSQADGIRWTLPTSIAPRYGSETYRFNKAKGAQEEGGISIIVDVDVGDSSSIQSLQSPSHPIAVTIGKTSIPSNDAPVMHKASATLALRAAQLDDDFVLVVSNKDNGMPTAFLETHPGISTHRALMVDLVPKFSLPLSRPDFIFVVDRSGSMQQQIPTLISALKVFLKSLPMGVKFNICSFGSHYSFLWPISKSYDSDSLSEALTHVQGFSADFGGTQTHAALKGAIDGRFRDLDCEILLLTDGDIWNQGELFDYLNHTVGESIRVFALGIGGGVSSALIEGVARAGKGFAQMIGEGENLDKKVVRMLKGALSPHISDYTLEVKYENLSEDRGDSSWELVEKVTDTLRVMTTKEEKPPTSIKPISLFDQSVVSDDKGAAASAGDKNQDPFGHLPSVPVPKLLQTPHEIPPLFPFTRTNVYLLMSPETMQKEPKSVLLRGTSPQGPLELEIQIQTLAAPGKKIHHLAAKKAMQELEEGRGWLSVARDNDGRLLKDRHPSCFDEIVTREAVRLGVQCQVGGKWCSFVAVSDPAERLECKGKKRKQVSQAGYPRLSNTASSSLESVLSGPTSFSGLRYFGSSNPVIADSYRRSAQDRAPPQMRHSTSRGCKKVAVRREEKREEKEEGEKDMGFGLVDDCSVPDPAKIRQERHHILPTATGSIQSSAHSPSNLFGSFYSSGSNRIRIESERGGVGGRGEVSTCGAAFSHDRLPSVPSGMKDFEQSGAPPSPLPPATASEKVHAIIDLQTFEGHWEVNEELFSIMGLDKSSKTKRTTEEMTMLVIVFLEERMAAEKDVWELVVEKARACLDKLPGMENSPGGDGSRGP